MNSRGTRTSAYGVHDPVGDSSQRFPLCMLVVPILGNARPRRPLSAPGPQECERSTKAPPSPSGFKLRFDVAAHSAAAHIRPGERQVDWQHRCMGAPFISGLSPDSRLKSSSATPVTS